MDEKIERIIAISEINQDISEVDKEIKNIERKIKHCDKIIESIKKRIGKIKKVSNRYIGLINQKIDEFLNDIKIEMDAINECSNMINTVLESVKNIRAAEGEGNIKEMINIISKIDEAHKKFIAIEQVIVKRIVEMSEETKKYYNFKLEYLNKKLEYFKKVREFLELDLSEKKAIKECLQVYKEALTF